MKLHENKELFELALLTASKPVDEGGLGIKPLFVEKDYWICRSLALLASSDISERIVFKGGTSLTKAYMIGTRFSEDIDIAVLNADSLSGNQLKTLIRKTAHQMTQGLNEISRDATSKGSHYHKAFYQYPRIITDEVGAIKPGELLLEINSFANPFPYQVCTISSFLTDFMLQRGQNDMIEQYNMQPIRLKVLDKTRTMTEKLVSLMRCSLADEYMTQMTAKIRHFYDLHYLYQDSECREYIQSAEFSEDFGNLLEHDRQSFAKPTGWQQRQLSESPLITNLHTTWLLLQPTYLRELPQLAYRDIPSADAIESSIQSIMSYIV